MLGGGSPIEEAEPSTLLRDRMEVLRDGPELPIGIAREALLHLAAPQIFVGRGLDVLIRPDSAQDEVQLAWAIMTNIPLHPLTRGQCLKSAGARKHFAMVEHAPYPDYAGSTEEEEDRRWWRGLIGTIIRCDPAHLLEWLYHLRTSGRERTFQHLIAMNLWRAVDEEKELLEEDWPPAMRDKPPLRPLHALACLCEFIRIAQLQRALLHWSFVQGKELTADSVVKELKNYRDYRRVHPVIEQVKCNSQLQALAFGEPNEESIPFLALRRRLLVRLAAWAFGGAHHGEFLRPRKPKGAEALADSFGNHFRYRPDLKRNGRGVRRGIVKRSSAITYWGLDFRDLPGVLLLDLWFAAQALAGLEEESINNVPADLRDAIAEIELVWIEQASPKLLLKQVRAVRSGARNCRAIPLPSNPDYRPSLVARSSAQSSAKKLQKWKGKRLALPAIEEDGALSRARPDLWWRQPNDEELLPFKTSQSFVVGGLRDFKPEHLCRPVAPLSSPNRGACYKAALRDVRALSGAHASLRASDDPICAMAVANLSLVLSPLSLDAARDLTNPHKRRLALRPRPLSSTST